MGSTTVARSVLRSSTLRRSTTSCPRRQKRRSRRHSTSWPPRRQSAKPRRPPRKHKQQQRPQHPTQRKGTDMADEKSTKTFGQFAETTKNGVAKYNSGWGTQYV